MEWFGNLFLGNSTAHSIMILALTIAIGVFLGKFKFKGVTLGVTWILFIGILFSHFGMTLDPKVEHFAKELGLILFVYSIGLQVGPGFFSSLKKGGLSLNLMASSIVLLSCIITFVIHKVTGTELSTMVGVLSGAITNTPGLGAAQQTLLDSGVEDTSILASAYAVAYPLGVVGIIGSMIFLRAMFKNKLHKLDEERGHNDDFEELHRFYIKVTNPNIFGKTIKELALAIPAKFVVSRIINQNHDALSATGESVINKGDYLKIVANPKVEDSITTLIGEKVVLPNESEISQNRGQDLVSRKIVVTKESVNGRSISELNIRSRYNVNISRVQRAGIEMAALFDLKLQLGDRVNLVGKESDVQKVADVLGNSMKRLNHPNLFPIFIGIFIGIVFGSIPFMIPGIPQPIKLGLAGGPLIVAILMARFGPLYKIVTFTTTSANMMLREIGISLFLACVGLGAGENFIETITNGGYWWVLYGVIITIVPILVVGSIAVLFKKVDGTTLLGLIAGSTTDPPALAYANAAAGSDRAAISYATVYPLTMFLRVLTAQIMILISLI